MKNTFTDNLSWEDTDTNVSLALGRCFSYCAFSGHYVCFRNKNIAPEQNQTGSWALYRKLRWISFSSHQSWWETYICRCPVYEHLPPLKYGVKWKKNPQNLNLQKPDFHNERAYISSYISTFPLILVIYQHEWYRPWYHIAPFTVIFVNGCIMAFHNWELEMAPFFLEYRKFVRCIDIITH